MSRVALEAMLDEHAPRWRAFSRIISLTERSLTLAMLVDDDLLRHGGTVSGPALMTLADRAAYYLTLAVVAPMPAAVTANLDIHFLVRPQPDDIRARAVLLLAGSRVAVFTVDIYAREDLVAHATVTYALPATS